MNAMQSTGISAADATDRIITIAGQTPARARVGADAEGSIKLRGRVQTNSSMPFAGRCLPSVTNSASRQAFNAAARIEGSPSPGRQTTSSIFA
jgi:hypothetical protein